MKGRKERGRVEDVALRGRDTPDDKRLSDRTLHALQVSVNTHLLNVGVSCRVPVMGMKVRDVRGLLRRDVPSDNSATRRNLMHHVL